MGEIPGVGLEASRHRAIIMTRQRSCYRADLSLAVKSFCLARGIPTVVLTFLFEVARASPPVQPALPFLRMKIDAYMNAQPPGGGGGVLEAGGSGPVRLPSPAELVPCCARQPLSANKEPANFIR